MTPPFDTRPKPPQPTMSDLMAELKVQTPMIQALHRTMHGDLPDGSDGMKARMLHLETVSTAHADRFARSDKLLRNGLIGGASSIALAVLGFILTPNALAKLASFLGAATPPAPPHP